MIKITSKILRSFKNPQKAKRHLGRWAAEFANPKDTIVYFEGTIDHLPKPPDRDAEMKEMDLDDETHLKLLLELHRRAFDKRQNWDLNRFREYMFDHADYEIVETWGLHIDGELVGTNSMARYRRNPNIGAGCATALIPERHGEGWGKYMNLYRAQQMKEHGLNFVNNSTRIRNEASIYMQFKKGLRPKYQPDEWNSAPNNPRPVRWRANSKLKNMYQTWKQEDGNKW